VAHLVGSLASVPSCLATEHTSGEQSFRRRQQNVNISVNEGSLLMSFISNGWCLYDACDVVAIAGL